MQPLQMQCGLKVYVMLQVGDDSRYTDIEKVINAK